MIGAFYYFSILLLAFPLKARFRILRGWTEPARTAASIAIVQYAGTWLAFLAYFVLGMGPTAFGVAAVIVIILNIHYWKEWACHYDNKVSLENPFHGWFLKIKENWVFILFVFLFAVPFVWGLSVGHEGQIYFRFNFIDSAFHLSLSQAFLTHTHFPPLDLNAAGQPLIYHFMADFLVAFLSLGGLDLARTMHGLNICNAVIAAIVLWSVAERLLKNPRPLVTGTVCAMFCFLMPAFANALHWYIFSPAYFPSSGLWAHLSYPYYNFEYIIHNLFEPQRPFPFSLPIILLILDAMCALWKRYRFTLMLETVWLYALMPFSHMMSFLVLSGYFMLVLIHHRKRWVRDSLYFLLPGLLAGLQVLYFKGYSPGFTAQYSGWDAMRHLPLQDFQRVPGLFRSAVYWFFVDGEFLVFGGLGLVMAYWFRRREETKVFFQQPILPFLGVSAFFFVLINFYRFSRNWGDSNKFVMFLNLWLSLIFGQMLTILLATRRSLGKILALLALSLALGPYLFHLQTQLFRPPAGLFSKADALAALWITQHTEANDAFVTTPQTLVDFVSALAGRSLLHGMYVTTQPYYDPRIQEGIQRLYENADFGVLRAHSVQYIKISADERRQYHLNSIFDQPLGLVYSDGSHDDNSIRIYNATTLIETGNSVHPLQHR